MFMTTSLRCSDSVFRWFPEVLCVGLERAEEDMLSGLCVDRYGLPTQVQVVAAIRRRRYHELWKEDMRRRP